MKSEKITTRGPRSYGDACAAAHALDLVGERWALLVLRELMLGPRRFGDLRHGLPGISANVLTQRLEGLEEAGIVFRHKLPPPSSVQVYELTEWGYEAEPIFKVLGRWGARSPQHDPTLAFSAASLVLSLHTMFDPERGGGFKKRIGLRVERHDFLVRVRKSRLMVEETGLDGADCILVGDPSAIAAAVYGNASLRDLAAEGRLAVEGDAGAFEKFARFFPLPDKSPRTGTPAALSR